MLPAGPGEARVPGAPPGGVRTSLPPNEQITRDREHSLTMRVMKRTLVYIFLTMTLPLFAFERQPNADYHARREHLAARLNGGVFLSFAGTEGEGQNNLHGFHQDEDFYYLTGWREPGAAVLIAPATADRPYMEELFLPGHN